MPMPAESRVRFVARWVFAGFVLVLAAWGIWQAQRIARGDFASMQARYRIDAWLTGKTQWSVPQWVAARDDLLDAARMTPDNPVTFDYLAVINMLRGQRAWSAPSLRKAYFGEALNYQLASLQLRRENGAAWANLALSQYALDESAAAYDSMRLALRYGPHELRVKQLLSGIVLSQWAEAPEDLKNWLLALYRDGKGYEKRDIERLAKQYGVSIKDS